MQMQDYSTKYNEDDNKMQCNSLKHNYVTQVQITQGNKWHKQWKQWISISWLRFINPRINKDNNSKIHNNFF